MRRRLFGAVLTAAMLVSLVPTLPTAAAAEQLSTPVVEWVTETKTFGDRTFRNGQVVLTDIPESMPNYHVEIINTVTGEVFDQYEDGFGGGSRTVQEIWVGWYTEAVMPSGTYTASVTYLGNDGVTYTDSAAGITQPYTYTAPGVSYAVPTGVAWNGANFAYTVEEAAQNQSLFMEFAKVEEDGTYRSVGRRADSVQYAQETNNASFLERLNERVVRFGAGEYVFRIRVISQDITKAWHSGWSDWSEPRYISGADEDLTGSLGGIIQDLEQNPDNKQAAVNAVQALDQEALLLALSADQDGTGVAKQLQDLEEKLDLTTTINQVYDFGMDTSLIQVVGAGLNASDLSAPPAFTIDKPEADREIPNTYRNTVQMDFSLPGAATNQDGTLKVPIQITMPVPEGIDHTKLRIIHFRGNNTTEEFTPHTYQATDGTWMARFTVSSLSPFVFAEYQPFFEVTFDPNGGTVEPGTMTTDETGKLTGTLPTPAKPGCSFQYWSTALENGQQVNSAYVFTRDTTVYALWTENQTPSGGGGGGSTPTYSNTVSKSENGSVTLSAQNAAKGSTVTLTVTPDQGYVLDTLTVTDRDGNVIEVTKTADGKYTFQMPGSAVTVKAAFKEKTPAVPALPFGDVAESAWYHDAVAYVYEKGIMTGTGDGTFSPNQNLTRGMMVTMLYRLAGEPAPSGGSSFTDVTSGAWYADSAAWAAANGVASGYGGGKFGPEDPITREQMALFLYNYAKLQGEDLTASAGLSTFTDGAQVSGWARYAMQWAVGKGLIEGSNSALNPQGAATRAEVAQLFANLLKQD